MISRVFFLFLFGVIAAHLGYAQKLPKVKKPNMKVYINITRDTLTMKFHRPNQSIKLEGFILGYGSNYFTNQYIQWPDNGKSFITDVEAEARYLIAVKPNENHKTCKEKNSSQKPLQLVIGTLTPTSVYLSWGILINPQVDWSALSKCPNDRFYTVRYREKNKDWNFQLCPTTETVVDNLKPNTAYEFCVKDNSDDEIWSKPQNHKTSPKGKENGNIENTYKIPKGTLQYASEDTKALIPVMVVKQGFQNITKSTAAPPPTVQSTVFREKTKRPPLTTTRPPTPKPKPASKVTESLPVPKTSEKTIAEDPKPAVTSQTIVESFTPDSSTGTLEWVRAASPTISPVSFTKELPILQPETVLASDELATYVPQPMTISHIIPDVPESNDVQHVSTGMPIKLHTTSGKGMRPKSTLKVSKLSTHLPFHKHTTTIVALLPGDVPESIDVQQVNTDMPIKLHTTSGKGKHPKSTLVSKLSTNLPFQKHTIAIAGEEPISSEVPQLQSSTVSSDLLPEPPRTIAGDVPESNDVPQVSTGIPIKLRTTSGKGMHPKSTLVSKLSTHLPYQKHTSTIGDVPESIDVQQVSTDMPIKLGTTSYKGMRPKSTLVSKLSTHLPFQKHTSTIASPTIFPVSFTKELPIVQTVLASEPLATYVPQPITILHIMPAGEESISSEVPQLQSSTVSSHLLPEPPRTIAGKGMHPKTTLVSKLSTHLPFQKHKTTIAAKMKPIYGPTTISSLEKTHTYHATTSQFIPGKQSTMSSKTHKKPTEFIGNPSVVTTPKIIVKTTVQHPMPVPNEILSFHPKPVPSTEAPESEADSTLPESKIITTDAPHIYEPEKTTLASDGHFVVQKHTSTAKSHTAIAYRTTTTSFSTNTPTTSQRTQSTLASKKQGVSPAQPKIPLPKKTQTTTVPDKTQKIPHKKDHSTVGPTPQTATYRVQHSSSRPRTSLRPRTRPGSAQNGTTQGSTGDFNWVPGTIPGGRVLDSTKLLGVSRNISMEPNNTGKKTFSVSSPPLPPVKPTSLRRRIQYNNVTGRPRVTVSSPPLPPVKPTTVRRRPPTNVTARPIPPGCVLISRASSAPKLNCTVVYIKPPKVQPTLPATDEDFVDPTVFNISPKSDVDTLGKPRFTGPHVKYINKEDNIPCSITESLKYFPTEESTNQDITAPPQNPPSNLTVVTVEGCPSFVILDWGMPDNDTATEFTVISTENGAPGGKNQSIITTNQTYSTVENLKPDTKYDFKVVPTNPLGEGPASVTVEFSTESADPRVSEPVSAGKDAIWTEIRFKSDSYSECRGKQYVKRTWYKKFVGIQLCNSLRYKIYLSNSLTGTFYNIGDQSGYGEDHCQFVDSFLDGRTGQRILPEQLTDRKGFYRSVRQQPVEFGDIGGRTHTSYVHWYECGIAIPGKW
ncbi:target of Nesh-SH3 isoform X47 [Rana temporaria]|uniref:target of Nesh-SH3 isoform X47 n=1 Tax=Rana temporaria TaxID=8407 RepID=UPI001AAD912F|nr:target of Nesh-SH3 isoform X47 [Rana temporaria]